MTTALMAILSVVGGDVAKDATGVAGGDDVGGNVFVYNASGADRRAGSDGDTRQYLHSGAYPNVVADGHGTGVFKTFVAQLDIDGMSGTGDADIWSDKDIVADYDFCLVKDGEIKIGKEIVTHLNIVAIIDMKRLNDHAIVAFMSEQFV